MSPSGFTSDLGSIASMTRRENVLSLDLADSVFAVEACASARVDTPRSNSVPASPFCLNRNDIRWEMGTTAVIVAATIPMTMPAAAQLALVQIATTATIVTHKVANAPRATKILVVLWSMRFFEGCGSVASA